VNKAVIPVIIILAVGVPTAYAITITLGGDPVIINGILDLMGNRITNVGTPTASTDAATKAYVDSAPSTDTLALLGCSDTQIAQFVGSAWTCVADPAYTDAQAIAAVGPHTVDTDTVGGLFCSANQVARFDGSNWVCGTISTISLNIATLDNASFVGQYTSIAIGSDNNPVISYYDSSPIIDTMRYLLIGILPLMPN